MVFIASTSEMGVETNYQGTCVVHVFIAIVLSGIFGRLLRMGVIIVATSNRTPSNFNKVCSCGNSKAWIYSILISAHGYLSLVLISVSPQDGC